jgi:hypothetical protein
MPDERQWLQAEQSGQDDLAEKAFARVVAEMTAVDPSADFINRTVRLAWQAHARRRLVRRAALIAAALLITIVSIGLIYALTALAIGMVGRVAVLFSHGLVWLLTSASEGVRWWWVAERMGTAVTDTVAIPSAAVSIAVIEMIGLLGIYAFQRLLPKARNDTK